MFDLGGVLVELDSTWPVVAGLDSAEVHSWLASSADYRAFECGELSETRFLDALAAEFGRAPAILRRAFQSCIRGHYAGAADLLTELRTDGIRSAALSNTNPIHWAVFDPQRILRENLHPPLASHTLGARKPERAAFERASLVLRTSDVMFLDDSPTNVAAAREFGWEAVQVVGPEQARAAIAQRTGSRSGSS